MTSAFPEVDAGLLAAVADADAAAGRLAGLPDPGGAVVALAEGLERLAIDDVAGAVRGAALLSAAAARLSLPRGEARARRAHAQALCYANDFAAALVQLRAAGDLEERHGLERDAVRAGLTLVHVLVCTGGLAEAVAEGERARALAHAQGRTEMTARADVNIGVALRMQGRVGEALARFEAARRVFAQQPAARAQVDSNIGEALTDLDRFVDAERALRSALEGMDTAGAVQGAAIVAGNLADLAVRRGRVSEAVRWFERARLGMERAGAPTEAARLEAERAESLAASGLLDEAAASLARAVPVLRGAGMRPALARALCAEADGLLARGRGVEAERGLDEALCIYRDVGNRAGEGRALALRARALCGGGDHAGAVASAREAVAVAEAAGLRAQSAAAHAALAGALLAAGEAAAAAVAAERGLHEAERIGVATLRPGLLGAAAAARMALGQPAQACAWWERAADAVEALRASLPPERFRAAYHAEQAGIYAEWFAAVRSDADTGEAAARAFAIAERSRSRSLLDATDGAAGETPHGAEPADAVGDAGTRALLIEISEQREGVAALYAEREGRAERDGIAAPACRAAWADRLAARERAIRAAETRLAASGRFDEALARPRALAEVRDALGPAVLVEFVCAGDEVAAIVLGGASAGEGRVLRDLATGMNVRAGVEELSFQTGRAVARRFPGGALGALMRRDAEAALARLHELLWSPVDGLVGAAPCVVIPHGLLHAVPFAALRTLHRSGRGEGRTTTAPSASVLLALTARARARDQGHGGGALVVGVADPLAPRAEDEARCVADLIGASDCLLGPAATRAAFVRAARGRALVHLATHAAYSHSDPLASGIRLADGWLTPRDLATLDLGGATVVLSACDTGRGEASAADDIEGFARSLIVAGASQLIMSLWPVHDESTHGFMADMYGVWYGSGGAGLGPATRSASLAAAMEAARAALRARQPHPAAWAPFVCVGAL